MNVQLFLSNVIAGNSVKSLDVKNKKYYNDDVDINVYEGGS